MNDFSKLVIASSLSVGALASASAGSTDGPCPNVAVMTDEQLDATVAAGINSKNRRVAIEEVALKKPAAKKAPAKKAA